MATEEHRLKKVDRVQLDSPIRISSIFESPCLIRTRQILHSVLCHLVIYNDRFELDTLTQYVLP